MIEITKGQVPAWLAANQAARTAEYLASPPGSKPSPWNNAHIKTALIAECGTKCMYCESNPTDASYLAVEHIRPKRLFPELVLEWSNLGWACGRCNTHKGDYWTENPTLKLLNPYEDDPSEHLRHAGPMVVSENSSGRGVNTIRQCKLNRADLIISKAREIEVLDRALRLWSDEADDEVRKVLAEDVEALLDSSQEFTASLRAFAASRGFVSAAS